AQGPPRPRPRPRVGSEPSARSGSVTHVTSEDADVDLSPTDPPAVPGRPGPSVITTSGLTMDFGRVVALSDLTLEVGPGVTGLVGANGAGKSTLIKILLGLQTPTSGSATVLGHEVARDSDRIRRVVGYMPEHDCLPPD